MAVLVVRRAHTGDEVARREIMEAATRELRGTYGPRERGSQCGVAPSGVLVALKELTLVGTAEYVLGDDHVYVQGVAVHPSYRCSGVCRALLLKAEEIAKAEKRATLAICAIEETGNVKIFEKLGFNVVGRKIAPNHVSPSGGPVTQVVMEQKIA
jgi:ribosomal protein S18 acetylase RimI-like enzyme